MTSIGATCPTTFPVAQVCLSIQYQRHPSDASTSPAPAMPIEDIASHLHLLQRNAFKKLLSGRDWVLKFAYRMIMQATETIRHNPETVDDTNCARRFRAFNLRLLTPDFSPSPMLLVVTEHFDLQEVQAAMCKDCGKSILRTHREV